MRISFNIISHFNTLKLTGVPILQILCINMLHCKIFPPFHATHKFGMSLCHSKLPDTGNGTATFVCSFMALLSCHLFVAICSSFMNAVKVIFVDFPCCCCC